MLCPIGILFMKILNKNIKDLTGQVFGRLTVTSFAGVDKNSLWSCLCSCGNTKVIRSTHLVRGTTQSCGCYQKERNKAKSQKNPDDVNLTSLYHNYKWSAYQRKHPFELSKEEVKSLVLADCSYCGSPPTLNILTHKNSDTPGREQGLMYNGIDRIDNALGYTLSNSATACFICNRAKSSLTLLEWETWLQRITLYRVEKERENVCNATRLPSDEVR